MNKPLDLPDVTLEKSAADANLMFIRHKKTQMVTYVTVARLNAWLLRQLRQELVSTREKS